jgi:hypothetical protein
VVARVCIKMVAELPDAPDARACVKVVAELRQMHELRQMWRPSS